MGGRGRPHVLVDVEPNLLRDVLVTILETVGEDDVTSARERPPGGPALRFSAALVSARPVDRGLADVTIVLPAAGEWEATVWTEHDCLAVDLRAPLAVLEVLDTFCPAATPRAQRAAAWDGHPHPTAEANGNGEQRSGHHAGIVK